MVCVVYVVQSRTRALKRMLTIQDHHLRHKLTSELHSRPFPALSVPAQVFFLALKRPVEAANRNKYEDRLLLIDLLDRYGAVHPIPNALHYFGKVGNYRLKWESHTGFVTYTLFIDALSPIPFDPSAFGFFPSDWLKACQDVRVTSALIHIDKMPEQHVLKSHVVDWFEHESLAVSRILDKDAVMASDFRIDKAGHTRFAVFVSPGVGVQRVGRIVQRLCEMETYKTMSMLGFVKTSYITSHLREIDTRLSSLIEHMGSPTCDAETTLSALMSIATELENHIAQTSYRFGATSAYERIVSDRIEALRETRFEGRQTFSEFMLRSFDPAMRTVKAVERQLNGIAKRALTAAELLRTRVEVERSAQNQKLLEAMARRTTIQLKLQGAVEGLSIVAISYYAANLAVDIMMPLATVNEIEPRWLVAGLTPVVIIAVWLVIRKVRQSIMRELSVKEEQAN